MKCPISINRSIENRFHSENKIKKEKHKKLLFRIYSTKSLREWVREKDWNSRKDNFKDKTGIILNGKMMTCWHAWNVNAFSSFSIFEFFFLLSSLLFFIFITSEDGQMWYVSLHSKMRKKKLCMWFITEEKITLSNFFSI